MYKWNVLNWKKPWEKCQLETVFRCSRLVYHTLVLEKNIMKEFWDFPCWKLIFFLIDLSQPLGPNPSFLTNVDILWSSSILGDRGGSAYCTATIDREKEDGARGPSQKESTGSMKFKKKSGWTNYHSPNRGFRLQPRDEHWLAGLEFQMKDTRQNCR